MTTLLTYKMGWVAKSSNNLFINEFNNVFNHVVLKYFCFYPFSSIISCYYDILIFSVSCCWFDWSRKIKTPFHEGIKCHNRLNGPLPLCHVGFKRWQM